MARSKVSFLLQFFLMILPSPSVIPQSATLKDGLPVRVMDENNQPIGGARVRLEGSAAQVACFCETDYAGRCVLSAGDLSLTNVFISKEGFYLVHLKGLPLTEGQNLEVILHHVQEYNEVVTVLESPPNIELTDTSNHIKLVSQEILNLPYPSTRDFRNVLPLLPGVLQDGLGQIHPAGAASHQLISLLDGFTVNHPTTGLLDTRVSVDALRSVQLETSRYSTEYGQGSGGVLSLETGMGDDHYRLSATNFLPTLQFKEGFSVGKWTPRATFSGPLIKGKAWFFQGADADYNLAIFSELPRGSNRSASWRASSLSKAQFNWDSQNILTTSLLINHHQADHDGLSRFSPQETTKALHNDYYLWTVKNQTFFTREWVLETAFGIGVNQESLLPQGGFLPYKVFPGGSAGNYFQTAESSNRRMQGMVNLFLPALQWKGRHQFKTGLKASHLIYRQDLARQPYSILHTDGSLLRRISFSDHPRYRQNNLEAGFYLQDRWQISPRLFLEMGLRLEEDRLIRQMLPGPRLAATYLLDTKGFTKLSFGAGLFYDATRLDLVSRSLAGRRWDQFYEADGKTPLGPPLETSFQVDPSGWRAPRFLNWSLGLEQMLPASSLLRVEYLRKRGKYGLAFFNLNQPDPQTGMLAGRLWLQPAMRDRYDAVEITVRRQFKRAYMILASYTRSLSRSNAVLDFPLENPVFSRQAGGSTAWDAPNRMVSWGWMPLWKRFDLAYSMEGRDGFPFSLVNQAQQLLGSPNSHRYPSYFALNVHVERPFQWLKYRWALRLGCNNLTNRSNPTAVDNNIDSPQYLTYGGLQHRVFTTRIRFIGRK